MPCLFSWYRDVLKESAFVILGSQLSQKTFISLLRPQGVSCSMLGALLSVAEHRGLSLTPHAPWMHNISLGHMSSARYKKTVLRCTRNDAHLPSL